MPGIKSRIERLEAAAPMSGVELVTEVHRVIVGKFTPEGLPRVIIRRMVA